MGDESANQTHEASIKERTLKLYQTILARPEVPIEPVTRQERSPDKSYDNLSVKIPYHLKVEFQRIANKRRQTPSGLAREVIEEFVRKNKTDE